MIKNHIIPTNEMRHSKPDEKIKLDRKPEHRKLKNWFNPTTYLMRLSQNKNL